MYHLSAKTVPRPNLQCTYSLFQIDQKTSVVFAFCMNGSAAAQQRK